MGGNFRTQASYDGPRELRQKNTAFKSIEERRVVGAFSLPCPRGGLKQSPKVASRLRTFQSCVLGASAVRLLAAILSGERCNGRDQFVRINRFRHVELESSREHSDPVFRARR